MTVNFKVDQNLEEFSEQIRQIADERLTGLLDRGRYQKKFSRNKGRLLNLMQLLLTETYQTFRGIPTDPGADFPFRPNVEYKSLKSQLIGADLSKYPEILKKAGYPPDLFERTSGGDEVISSKVNWEATGQLGLLMTTIEQVIKNLGDVLEISYVPPIKKYTEKAIEGYIDVDKRMMELTGNNAGVMRINNKRQKRYFDLLEVLIVETARDLWQKDSD